MLGPGTDWVLPMSDGFVANIEKNLDGTIQDFKISETGNLCFLARPTYRESHPIMFTPTRLIVL